MEFKINMDENKSSLVGKIVPWLVDLSIPVGWIVVRETGQFAGAYGRWITLMHWWCWGVFILGLVCLTGVSIMAKSVDKLVTNLDADKLRSTADATRSFLKLKHSWKRRLHTLLVDWPVLIFIYVAMADVSLFIAFLFACWPFWLLPHIGAAAHDKIPLQYRGEDKDKNGVPDKDEQAIDEAATDPITGAVKKAKAKRAVKDKVLNKIADALIGGDEEDA